MTLDGIESAHEVDRVTYFDKCCQAFSPIIFGLNKHSGYEEFMREFKGITTSIKRDTDIIQKLVSISWLKS